MPTRRALIDIVWRQIERDVFVTKAEFERSVEGWEITPVEINGKLSFITMNKGPEFHFVSFGGAPISMRLGRSWLEPILEREGYVTTRTPKDARRQQRFNEKVGFVAVSESEFYVHYRMDRCPQSP